MKLLIGKLANSSPVRSGFLLMIFFPLFSLTTLNSAFQIPPINSDAQIDLVSGDLLLLHDKKIWLLDSTDLTETLLFDPQVTADEEISSDVVVSPERRYVYFVVAGKESGAVNKLVRYEVSLKTLETIYESTELGRISPLSPNGNQILLNLVSLQIPSWSICLLNITEKSCQSINVDWYDPNAIFWLDDNKIITETLNGIVTYELDGDQAPLQSIFQIEGSYISGIGMFSTSDKRFYASIVTRTSYDQQLMSVNSDLSDYSAISHTPIKDSAIAQLAVSYDAVLLAYQQALRLTVINIETGGLVTRLEDIQRFVWPRDNNKIILLKTAGRSEYLTLLDLTTGKTLDGAQHLGEMYLITVP